MDAAIIARRSHARASPPMRANCIFLSFVAACSSDGNPNPNIDASNPPVDAKVFMDAPPTVPPMVEISGTAAEGGLSGSTPVAGVTIEVFRIDDTTPIGTAVTDAQGKYSIMIPTNGMPVNGYVKGSKSGTNYKTSYSYPPGPVIENSLGNDLNMITNSNFNLLNQFAGGNQMAGKGVIALAVVEKSGGTVSGATVVSVPAAGPYRYNDTNGYPSSQASATAGDGFAYIFNVGGKVTINAMKSGMQFKAHDVIGHPDGFITTAIVSE
jgi:hypothetical protein